MEKLVIREERASDKDEIYNLTKIAFSNMEHAAGDEQDLIDTLRDLNALTLSLVATKRDKIIGHIAFSPATNENGNSGWFALGPVSVLPKLQRHGIGSALIDEGLRRLRERGAKGCILVGHLDYYPRFGFKPMPQNAPNREPAAYFMVLPFAQDMPQGKFAFHQAFYNEE